MLSFTRSCYTQRIVIAITCTVLNMARIRIVSLNRE